MPRQGPRKKTVGLKLAPTTTDRIDQIANDHGRNRSETVRMLIAYSLENMPADWQPAPIGDETS